MLSLYNSVLEFASLTSDLQDADLELPWDWGEYEEGVRFAFFRAYEELCLLAARLVVERSRFRPLSLAQRLLGEYHAAYRDLHAVLLGVSDAIAVQPPAPGEWPLRKALLHIVEAERTFFAITNYSVDRERAQDGRALEMSDQDFETFWAGDPFEQLKENGSFSEILTYYDQLHTRVLESLVDITDLELDAPVVFWESQPMPVRFRLGRFSSHLRQHTVQMEKALVALNMGPAEAKRLLRLIYGALAEAEGCRLGAPELGTHLCQALAGEIEARTLEIVAALK